VGARAGELHTRICLAFYADLVLVVVFLRQQLCTCTPPSRSKHTHICFKHSHCQLTL
jgi:hypothetical protein